jgi:hypothetical protein
MLKYLEHPYLFIGISSIAGKLLSSRACFLFKLTIEI